MNRQILSLAFALISIGAGAQIKAKAISYAVEADMAKFNPDAAATLSQTICKFEVDAYFTDTKLRTIVRTISLPPGFTFGIRQRLYELKSKDEYNIDHDNQFMLHKKDQDFKPKATKVRKNIMGYPCVEYVFTDYRKVRYRAFVTDKLPANICPYGNFSLKGTALEITASNGLHFLATDTATGELADNFFDLPKGYTVEEVPAPAQKSK